MLDKDDLQYGHVRDGMPIQDIIRLFDAAADPALFAETQTRGRMGELARSIYAAHRAQTQTAIGAYQLTMEDLRMIGERLSHNAQLSLSELSRDIQKDPTMMDVEIVTEGEQSGEQKSEIAAPAPWKPKLQ